jgi:hypothetical protein
MFKKGLFFGEIAIIVLLASTPLFVSFPYRVNIFLSWEGAYRMSQGQIPFRDFGLPLGGMYWVVPAIFFKIFGVKLITLVKAQVFLNIIAGLSFLSILKSFKVSSSIRFVSVLVFCISYSFFNFWPWYNNSVIIYELIALAFLARYINDDYKKFPLLLLFLSALFTVFSFFTKQDGGALAFLLCTCLLAAHAWCEKKWIGIVSYIGFFALIILLIVLPFKKYDFGYWFNIGQAPHSSRFSVKDLLNEFFGFSLWIKFYLFLILLILVIRINSWKQLFSDKTFLLFTVFTLGILAEAAIFQVTSYTPPDNNIFFHSFAFSYILAVTTQKLPFNFNSVKFTAICSLGVLLWWSSVYWKYFDRVIERFIPKSSKPKVASEENVVDRNTFMIIPFDSADIPMSKWVYCGVPVFDKIYMPEPTGKRYSAHHEYGYGEESKRSKSAQHE